MRKNYLIYLDIACSEIPFSESWYRMEISPLINNVNWLAGFCIVRAFTERYFLKRRLYFSICWLCFIRWQILVLPSILLNKRRFFLPLWGNYYDLLRKYKFLSFIRFFSFAVNAVLWIGSFLYLQQIISVIYILWQSLP